MRWTSLSEAEGLAWARVPGLSKFMRFPMFVCACMCGLATFSYVKGVYACGVVFRLKGLSPIGVWDVFDSWTHDGHGTGWVPVGYQWARSPWYGDFMCRAYDGQGIDMFSSATIERGVHSMVIACVSGSKLRTLGWFTTDEESVGQDYEWDRLIGLDHEWVSFVGAQGNPKT